MPLQVDMFSGELVDARSRAQRSRNREDAQLRQISMFSARETIQVGVSARPWLKDLARPTLTLEVQDLRTDEEKERDFRHQAEALTTPMFVAEEDARICEPVTGEQQIGQPSQAIYKTPTGSLRRIGFRAYVRRNSTLVRYNGGE